MRTIEPEAPVWVQLFIDNVAGKPKNVEAHQYALVAPRRTALFEISGGHPFYAKCLVKALLEENPTCIGLPMLKPLI